MQRGSGTINFKVYNEDSDDVRGVARITMPNITHITTEISGAGIAGNIEDIFPGHIEAMEMEIEFLETNGENQELNEPRIHALDLRAPERYYDSSAGSFKIRHVRHSVRIIPKGTNLGNLQVASSPEGSGTYIVKSLITHIDGNKTTEIDQENFVFMVNGIDYLEETRRALGM